MTLKLILILLLALPQGLHFYHKGMESGLAQMPINGLYQDEFGTLWAGTKDGVKYCDGSSFIPLSLAAGLDNRWVISSRTPTVCGDGKGSVFITANYLVFRYNLDSERAEIIFKQENSSIPPNISIHCGASCLWIGCDSQIVQWMDGRLKEFSIMEPGISVSALLEYDGILYVGTTQGGLLSCSTSGGQWTKVTECDEVMTLFADSRGHIWCGTLNQGAFCINKGSITHYHSGRTPSLNSDFIRAIAEDPSGHIWLGTSQGIDILDESNNKVFHIGSFWNGAPALSEQSVWSLLCDKFGTMWIGSYYGGLDYCTFNEELFQHDNLGLNRVIVSKIAFDSNGCIWLATEGHGLIRQTDSGWKPLDTLPFSKYNIKDILFDSDSVSLWVCTHMGGVWRYDTITGACRHYTINDADITARSEATLAIVNYNKRLFVGTLQGAYWLDPASGKVNAISELNKHIYEIDRIMVSRDSLSVWVAGSTICRYQPSNGTVTDYSECLSKITGGLSTTSISIIEDAQGRIFAGTAGFALLEYDPTSDEFRRIIPHNSTSSNEYIGAILSSRDGRLLLGTSKGLCLYDTHSGRINTFDEKDGFYLGSMIPGAICRNGDNLFMGGRMGLAICKEESLLSNSPVGNLSLVRLSVNGTEVHPDDESGILRRSIRHTDRISLPHGSNILLYVGIDNPLPPAGARYLYRLEGLEKDWNTHNLATPISYSDLPPGRYVLCIGNPVTPSTVQVHLGIRIRPPFYFSWYAWVLYLLLIFGGAGFVFYFIITKLQLKTSLDMERQKMRFFANMSHELRTPLTLLIGRLELFRDKQQLSSSQKAEVDGIHGAATEMIELVNNQMDVLKMGEKALELNTTNGDIVDFVRGIVTEFKVLAERKGISLKMSSEIPSCEIAFDPSQMKKVFGNLLSNAIKYSPQNSGKIRVSVHAPHDGMIGISVKDNGIGIDESAQSRIFDRFFQSKNAVNSDPSVTGTGIGLYVVSYIVRLHGGEVKLESRLNKGSTFTVSLPLGKHEEEMAVSAEPILHPTSIPQQEKKTPETSRKNKLLLVEDDERLRTMLRELFKDTFEVYEADNGENGLAVAEKTGPDLIISDIMMPVIGGDEFCRRIKADFSTCHIPVILLTALADVEHGIKGFDCGADDYITKPFNTELLVARCDAILRNRALLQKRYSTDVSASPQMLSPNNADIAFMDKLVKLVDDNLLEKTITVPFLCEQMAMGHTKLFNKIKGLTGGSPQEFIQNARIKYAARMLRERDDLNVSDVAYQLGFSSLNYFEKCFRKAFGQTPTEYRKMG